MEIRIKFKTYTKANKRHKRKIIKNILRIEYVSEYPIGMVLEITYDTEGGKVKDITIPTGDIETFKIC